MLYIDIWKMLEELVENHDGPYCFEACELEEIRQVRAQKLSQMNKAMVRATKVLKHG